MPEYYQRTFPVERTPGGVATLTGNYNAGGVAPHANTARWTYTVPSSRAAQIESAIVVIQRNAAAAPVGACAAYILAAGVTLLYATELNNTVGQVTQQVLGLCGFLAAGEVLQGLTLDGSTGGTHDLVACAHYREFAV